MSILFNGIDIIQDYDHCLWLWFNEILKDMV
jgi:hypothetical protein